jgi:hypothetical protein
MQYWTCVVHTCAWTAPDKKANRNVVVGIYHAGNGSKRRRTCTSRPHVDGSTIYPGAGKGLAKIGPAELSGGIVGGTHYQGNRP